MSGREYRQTSPKVLPQWENGTQNHENNLTCYSDPAANMENLHPK